MTTPTYHRLVPSTRRGGMLFALWWFGLALVTSAARFATHPGLLPQNLIVLIWLAAPMLPTMRILNKLEELERTHNTSDDMMRFLFDLALVLPMIGYVPLLALIARM